MREWPLRAFGRYYFEYTVESDAGLSVAFDMLVED
jgi:hypothetical protein